MNKKGNAFIIFWFFVMLIFGFLISYRLRAQIISALLIILIGLVGGKVIYERPKNMELPVVLILIGFLIGYLVGDHNLSNILIILIFVFCTLSGYHLSSRVKKK